MDTAPLRTLFAALPDHEAEDIVCRALEDIAAKLDYLQNGRTTGAFSEISAPAKRLAAVAEQIGLTEVALVARHTSNAAEMQCGVALGATLARLERAFDAAVSHVWDFRHYSH
ncbi:hypothetical protein MWU61_11845 [Loktanella sp. F6476L]|uniref:hypothetical protein n=1 Tax=Loktanella sp. F6476L TaxID=2926405 RepID=UPI001FF306C2|nr:hypothetical protein [Loktanella sp. F6476L]MCK0121235.1 hypothetical protein [Loktanella sp. F6476L]